MWEDSQAARLRSHALSVASTRGAIKRWWRNVVSVVTRKPTVQSSYTKISPEQFWKLAAKLSSLGPPFLEPVDDPWLGVKGYTLGKGPYPHSLIMYRSRNTDNYYMLNT